MQQLNDKNCMDVSIILTINSKEFEIQYEDCALLNTKTNDILIIMFLI